MGGGAVQERRSHHWEGLHKEGKLGGEREGERKRKEERKRKGPR
jgi:hypothetical protein